MASNGEAAEEAAESQLRAKKLEERSRELMRDLDAARAAEEAVKERLAGATEAAARQKDGFQKQISELQDVSSQLQEQSMQYKMDLENEKEAHARVSADLEEAERRAMAWMQEA